MDTKHLEQHLRFLRNAAPVEYDAMVKAFDFFTDGVTVEVTNAGPDRIMVLAGHAQMARKVLMLMTDAMHPPKGSKTNPPTP